MHWTGWIVVLLALNVGGWFAFDGGHALAKGDYVTPKKGAYAGQLGGWSKFIRAVGIDPRSTLMKTVFLVYGLRTALRHATHYGFDERGVVATGPVSRAIEWGELVNVKLSYYTTKRDGTSGWWQLDIKGRDSKMRIESTLDGFGALAERAVREARAHDIELSPATIENLRPLGIELADRGQ